MTEEQLPLADPTTNVEAGNVDAVFENVQLRAQVAELLPWARRATQEAVSSMLTNGLDGETIGEAFGLLTRITAGEFTAATGPAFPSPAQDGTTQPLPAPPACSTDTGRQV